MLLFFSSNMNGSVGCQLEPVAETNTENPRVYIHLGQDCPAIYACFGVKPQLFDVQIDHPMVVESNVDAHLECNTDTVGNFEISDHTT